MPRKGHSEEQVVYALRQIEGGKKVSEVCREMGVSPQAVYRWKRRCGGLGLNEVRELRQLREENRKLKSIEFVAARNHTSRHSDSGSNANLDDCRSLSLVGRGLDGS